MTEPCAVCRTDPATGPWPWTPHRPVQTGICAGCADDMTRPDTTRREETRCGAEHR